MSLSSPGQAARADMQAAARPCPTLVLDEAFAGVSHPWASSRDLLVGISASRPQVIGYPGHHLADYWNWQTGWLDVPNLRYVTGLPALIQELLFTTGCNNLDDLRTVCSAAAAPVLFSANLLIRNPRLNGSGSADPLADAAAGRTFLLNGLQACVTRGISPHWLLLGDGLAGEQSWAGSPANRVFRGDPISGLTEYPLVAKNWAAAAHQSYPNITIAAFANGEVTSSPACVAQWNTHLVQQLTGQTDIHALAFSVTIPGGMGLLAEQTLENQRRQYALLKDAPSLRDLFCLPPGLLRTWLDQAAGTVTMRSSGFRFWLNAIHLNDPVGALRYTWAHGLLIANALQAVLSEPSIDLAVLHNTSDRFNAAFFNNPLDLFHGLQLTIEDGVDRTQMQNIPTGERTALGHVFALFLSALRDAVSAQPLVFPALNDPLLWGWAFYGNSGYPRSLLLGNLTGTEAVLDLSPVWSAAGGVMEGAISRADPWTYITRATSQPGVPYSVRVSRADAGWESPLRLPPYSLALFSGLRRDNRLYLPHIRK